MFSTSNKLSNSIQRLPKDNHYEQQVQDDILMTWSRDKIY